MSTTVTLPNTMVTTYSYDRAQRLTNLTNVTGATTITSHAYTLDSAGNRTALSEFVSGVTTGSSDSFGLTYDGLERLTAVTTTNPESFTLDGASNITARTGPTKTFSIDTSNRPTSDGTNTLTWSNADRLIGRGADTFGFDPLDRLTSSTVAGTARIYAYSGDGLLQSRTTAGTPVNLLWDRATSPSRLLVSGGTNIVYGLGPLYAVTGTTVTTYARDGQKSIRAELAGTSVTSSWRYRSYGEIAQYAGSAAPSNLGYAGQLLDPSGLYYMRARWYDSQEARFVTRDRLHGDLASPASLNAIAYADGRPTLLRDPSGFDPLLDENGFGGDGIPIVPVQEEISWFRSIWSRLLRLVGQEASSGPGADVVDNTVATVGSEATRTVDSAAVRFSQNSVSGQFRSGGTVDELAQALRSGSVDAADMQPIRIFQREGQWFSLDNRRLLAFQKAGLDVPYRLATSDEIAAEAWKFTTTNGGTSIMIRGGGGTWPGD